MTHWPSNKQLPPTAPGRVREGSVRSLGGTMKLSLPVIYLAINAACALAVGYAAHRVTALMALEQRTDSDSTDYVTFFFNSAPAFTIAVLTNVAWIGKMLADLWRHRGREALVWLGGAVIVWGAAIICS